MSQVYYTSLFTEWGVPGSLIVYRDLVYSNEPIQPKSDLALIMNTVSLDISEY